MANPLTEPALWREERARVFFALWPDVATANRLHALAEAAQRRFGGRVMRFDTLHLTLLFVGGVRRVRLPELIEAAASLTPPPFDLTLDTLGRWAKRDIVWAGPSHAPPGLHELVADLHGRLRELGFELEARRFVPHVTLLRGAECTDGQEPLAEPVRWRADGFALVESKRQSSGARYRLLGRWAGADR